MDRARTDRCAHGVMTLIGLQLKDSIRQRQSNLCNDPLNLFKYIRQSLPKKSNMENGSRNPWSPACREELKRKRRETGRAHHRGAVAQPKRWAMKSTVHKTCKTSDPPGLEIPARQNEPFYVLKSDDWGTDRPYVPRFRKASLRPSSSLLRLTQANQNQELGEK
jgi:hypothetical protein